MNGYGSMWVQPSPYLAMGAMHYNPVRFRSAGGVVEDSWGDAQHALLKMLSAIGVSSATWNAATPSQRGVWADQWLAQSNLTTAAQIDDAKRTLIATMSDPTPPIVSAAVVTTPPEQTAAQPVTASPTMNPMVVPAIIPPIGPSTQTPAKSNTGWWILGGGVAVVGLYLITKKDE